MEKILLKSVFGEMPLDQLSNQTAPEANNGLIIFVVAAIAISVTAFIVYHKTKEDPKEAR